MVTLRLWVEITHVSPLIKSQYEAMGWYTSPLSQNHAKAETENKVGITTATVKQNTSIRLFSPLFPLL